MLNQNVFSVVCKHNNNNKLTNRSCRNSLTPNTRGIWCINSNSKGTSRGRPLLQGWTRQIILSCRRVPTGLNNRDPCPTTFHRVKFSKSLVSGCICMNIIKLQNNFLNVSNNLQVANTLNQSCFLYIEKRLLNQKVSVSIKLKFILEWNERILSIRLAYFQEIVTYYNEY